MNSVTQVEYPYQLFQRLSLEFRGSTTSSRSKHHRRTWHTSSHPKAYGVKATLTPNETDTQIVRVSVIIEEERDLPSHQSTHRALALRDLDLRGFGILPKMGG
ncbi:hypothetical protein PM082_018690 [Marasmius tenuissimus]|nr:hypothetical protein PM082_018690 [Marasmius tenuissimus]